MQTSSLPLLLLAAGTVGFLHAIMPDHWVPLSVVARTQHWSLTRTARISLLASVGHVLTSIVLGALIAAVGLQFRQAFEAQQNRIVGVLLVLTGLGFAIWALTGHGGHHDHDEPAHGGASTDSGHLAQTLPMSGPGGILAILVPFGAAASPDLTILPIFLAAATVGIGAVVGVLVTFSLATLGTTVALTVAATVAGYQVQGEWLEEHGNLVTAGVLVTIGSVVALNVL